MAWHKASPGEPAAATIPGIGPLAATAIAATVPDPAVFRSGREFAAWLGLVPRQNSTGGKTRLGRTSRQGDAYIRRLLVIGAQSALWCSKAAKANPWVQALLAKRPRLVVAVAWPTRWRGSPGRSWRGRPPTGRGRSVGRGRRADACKGRSAMEWSVAPTDRGKCSGSGLAHRLQPHRIRSFKRSRDPEFTTKLADIVGPLRASATRRRAGPSLRRVVAKMGSSNRGPERKLFFAGIVCRVQGRLRGWHAPPHDGASREEPSNVDAALC